MMGKIRFSVLNFIFQAVLLENNSSTKWKGTQVLTREKNLKFKYYRKSRMWKSYANGKKKIYRWSSYMYRLWYFCIKYIQLTIIQITRETNLLRTCYRTDTMVRRFIYLRKVWTGTLGFCWFNSIWRYWTQPLFDRLLHNRQNGLLD